MTLTEFEKQLNNWGQHRVPFLFLIDFEMNKPIAFALDKVENEKILYEFNGVSNAKANNALLKSIALKKHPLPFNAYKDKFDLVHQHLTSGDSYLTNLTVKTEIDTAFSLDELFHASKARYKLMYEDQFLVFSPEIFVQISENTIYSYPMKGTINADIPHAAETILNNQKELAEHITIVDLIRNDLSQVAKNVRVTKFRYLDTINTNEKTLLQVSSEIAGSLENPFDTLGTLLLRILPAGSVTGAPKDKTIQIIRQAEGEPRGYYTGVMGLFDGRKLDSGVMIRYIEQVDGKKFYRSGGGITFQSNCFQEYQEAIDKIYVPVN